MIRLIDNNVFKTLNGARTTLENVLKVEVFLEELFPDIHISGYLSKEGLRNSVKNYDGGHLNSVLVLHLSMLFIHLNEDSRIKANLYFGKEYEWFDINIVVEDEKYMEEKRFEVMLDDKFSLL